MERADNVERRVMTPGIDPPAASTSRRNSSASSHAPKPLPVSDEVNPGSSVARASQRQIVRSHQRDSAQIRHLVEVTSELVRSIAGTRWLAHRQIFVDLLVKAVYLFLTLGRGVQTMGEEYTDILPFTRSLNGVSRTRRVLTILFLLIPSAVTSPSAAQYLRSATAKWPSVRLRLASFLESPIGQSLPELHMIAFLYGGRFLEFGRRVTGLTYLSTLPPRPRDQRPASYEPLAILLALPVLYRIFPRRSTLPPPVAPIPPEELTSPSYISPEADLKPADYDEPNTYLTPEAQALPERQCTLCLESRGTGQDSGGTVAVTECGHVFCWCCLGSLEKAECPLCRQSLRMERLIAAYNL